MKSCPDSFLGMAKINIKSEKVIPFGRNFVI